MVPESLENQDPMHHHRRSSLYAALALLAACSSPDSPEAQIHKVIDRMETAAEARDTGAVLEFVSEHFRGDYAMDRAELAQYLRGYFIANQSIHLLTRVEKLEFPVPGEARADVAVARVGQEADAAGVWDVSAELHNFHVVLRNEDGAWKVTHAAPFAPH